MALALVINIGLRSSYFLSHSLTQMAEEKKPRTTGAKRAAPASTGDVDAVKHLRETVVKAEPGTMDPDAYRALGSMLKRQNIITNKVDPTNKPPLTGVIVDGTILRCTVLKFEEGKDKSAKQVDASITLEVLVDKPISESVKITNETHGTFLDNKTKVLIKHWVQIPMVDYDIQFAKGKRWPVVDKKRDYVYVVADDVEPYVFGHLSVIRVSIIKKVERESGVVQYPPHRRIRLTQVKRQSRYSAKKEEWFTSNDCQKAELLPDAMGSSDST